MEKKQFYQHDLDFSHHQYLDAGIKKIGFSSKTVFLCNVLVEPPLAKKKPLRVGAIKNSILRELIRITKFSFMELSGSWCDDEKPTLLIKQEFLFVSLR